MVMPAYQGTDIQLTPEQLTAFRLAKEAILDGRRLYLTGKAGTGKSTLIRKIKEWKPMVVLSPTGLAAINVGGQSIHSFFGLKPGDTKPVKNDRVARVLSNCAGIIIDEISMVRADLLDLADQCCRKSLEVDQPFGGKGVIFTGDHYQIEPVVSTVAEKNMLELYYGSPWFFDSDLFRNHGIKAFELTTIMRQSGDPSFREALNLIREGNPDGLELFNSRVLPPADDAIYITLTKTREYEINSRRLSALPGESKLFLGQTTEAWGNDYPAPRSLILKEGARVMMLRNFRSWDEPNYANGDIGTVIDLHDGAATVELDRGEVIKATPHTWEKREYSYTTGEGLTHKVMGSYCQMPMKLAYAVTGHKGQGQTYERSHVEFERRPFCHGLAYVALSRNRTLEGLTLGRALDKADLVINPRVPEWCREVGL